jgi:hypothetical protein
MADVEMKKAGVRRRGSQHVIAWLSVYVLVRHDRWKRVFQMDYCVDAVMHHWFEKKLR